MAVSIFSGGRAETKSAVSQMAMFQFLTVSLESWAMPAMAAMSFALRMFSASCLA